MNKEILENTVSKLICKPKGILAIDESISTCNTRFEKLGVATTEEKRREYRELLVTTPNIEDYVSGYILFDETLRQSSKSGQTFPSIMKEKGLEIGIKVDKGPIDLVSSPGDKVTEGLDGLEDRLAEYRNMGASFAKWRAVYKIEGNLPSEECMQENAVRLAKYALACQEADIVPIVEPEVLMDGEHSIEKCNEVTSRNLDIVFTEFNKQNVYIPGILLKTNMIISGKSAPDRASAEKVAEMTVKCLKEHVPQSIGGIVFLSGGQSDEEATENLNAMNIVQGLPWRLTFSYGRAIQNPALIAWAKNSDDVTTAQQGLLDAAKRNSLASIGQYKF